MKGDVGFLRPFVVGILSSMVLVIVLWPHPTAAGDIDEDEVAKLEAETEAGAAVEEAAVETEEPTNEDFRAVDDLLRLGHPAAAALVLISYIEANPKQWGDAFGRLEEIARTSLVDESAFEKFAYGFDGTFPPGDAGQMLFWFRARAYGRRGFMAQAESDLAKLSAKARWGLERRFDQAAFDVNESGADTAVKTYRRLARNTIVRNTTRAQAKVNLARLLFEKKQYVQAIKLETGLELPVREKARVLSEIGWAQFHLKRYRRALGMVAAANSVFFHDLQNPENDLLAVLSVRALCRNDWIKREAKVFQAKWAPSLKQIESRATLMTDPMLKQLALQSTALQNRATLINEYRITRKLIDGQPTLLANEVREKLLSNIFRAEKILADEIDRRLPVELDRAASGLVEVRDQIELINRNTPQLTNGEAAIDEFPVDYGFSRLYWPIGEEAWLSEVENYEVPVRSRCKR